MSKPFGGSGWLRVGNLIELFVAMGCEVRPLPGEITGPDGESWKPQFLYNPDCGGVVSLSDLDVDDRIPPRVVENWGRALRIEIPKPGNIQ